MFLCMMNERIRDRLARRQREAPVSALVTGATSGIGEAFARALPEETRLVLTGRNAEKLDALQRELGGRAEGVVADLTDRGQLDSVVAAAENAGCDLLINNAGLGEYGAFLKGDFERHRETLRVNVEAMLELMHRLVPGMMERADLAGRRAGLINVASSAAFFPVPTLATYAASKAMVLSFTESFAAEMLDQPIDVLATCPGATRTAFGERAGFKGGSFPNAMTPERVARASLTALGRQSTVVIGPVSAATFTPVALARSLFGQAFMRASRVMDRTGG